MTEILLKIYTLDLWYHLNGGLNSSGAELTFLIILSCYRNVQRVRLSSLRSQNQCSSMHLHLRGRLITLANSSQIENCRVRISHGNVQKLLMNCYFSSKLT